MHTSGTGCRPPPWRPAGTARRVVAIGTTSVRALESAAATGCLAGEDTGLFIHGAFPFQMVDVLVTNFHQPRSASLLVLLEAFAGPRWRELYGTALAAGYRFLSFGDAMLVFPWARARDPGDDSGPPAIDRGRHRRVRSDRGAVHTARGAFPTPCFMPVGTRGMVRTLDAGDLADLGTDVLLANTYHLMLAARAPTWWPGPGDCTGSTAGSGHMLTDSGGYQVFSLNPKVDDDGVTFRSTYDGSPQRLTPEGAVAVQEQLGADIQMALDICPPLPSSAEVVRTAVERTAAWAERARRAHRREGQAIFGIVQGGAPTWSLRAESAPRTVGRGVVGYRIGGL